MSLSSPPPLYPFSLTPTPSFHIPTYAFYLVRVIGFWSCTEAKLNSSSVLIILRVHFFTSLADIDLHAYAQPLYSWNASHGQRFLVRTHQHGIARRLRGAFRGGMLGLWVSCGSHVTLPFSLPMSVLNRFQKANILRTRALNSRPDGTRMHNLNSFFLDYSALRNPGMTGNRFQENS